MIREFLAVAANAALQWALASLLLANGAAFCLIAAAAARLRLGPPCILCARVHRLFCSSSASGGGGQERDALRLLLCDAHLAAVGSVAPETQARRARGHGDVHGVQESKDRLEVDDQHKDSGLETHRVVSIGSEICEQDHADEPPRAAGRSDAARTTTTDDGNSPLISLFELAPIVAHPPPRNTNDAVDGSFDHAATPEDLLTSARNDERAAAALRELDEVRAQLAAERLERAAAEEYRRQLEEQGELDREAARLAMQLVTEAEEAKHGLQRQLEACRVRAQLYDGCQVAGGEGGCRREANGGGGGNNYQSLVDFLPGSVYSSSPDLANLLKLYTEAGNGDRRQRDGYASAVAVVAEEEKEEVAVAVTAGPESVDTSTAIVGDSLHETSASCHVETVTEAA